MVIQNENFPLLKITNKLFEKLSNKFKNSILSYLAFDCSKNFAQG